MSMGNVGSEINNLLVQGFKAAKENRRDEAYNIFCSVVQREPNNEMGWLYRAATTDDLSEAYVCLQRVLSINPANEKAQRGIERIQTRLNDDAEEAASQGDDAGPAMAGGAMAFGGAAAVPRLSDDDVISGFNPASTPPPSASSSQATSRYPYEEPGTSPPYNQAAYGGDYGAETANNSAAAPSAYRPGFDAPDSGASPYDNQFSPIRPADDNYPAFQDNPQPYPQDELVDEPFEESGAARNRTQQRLRSGRAKEQPSDTTSGNRRVGGAFAPAFAPLSGVRQRGRAAFGNESATGLDQVGRSRSRSVLRILIIAALVLVVGLLLILFFTRDTTTPEQPAANATFTASSSTALAGSSATPSGPTPTPLIPGTGVPGATVPIVGGPTSGAATNQTPGGLATQAPAPPPVQTTAAVPPPGQTTQAPAPPPVQTTAAVPPPPAPPQTTQAPAPAPPAPGTPPRAAIYTVTRGDSLFAIAARFSTSVDAVRAANRNITGNTIFNGQRVVVPVSRPDFRGKDGVILEQNQTLQTLADRFKVSVDEIARFNGFANPADARPGDAILIP